MEEIISLLAHFQEELQVLTNDFQKVKNKIYNVYKENESLKEENENLKRLVFELEEVDDDGTVYDNLTKLYKEGFHVCHLDFGESRKGDCLFCMGVLAEREDDSDDD